MEFTRFTRKNILTNLLMVITYTAWEFFIGAGSIGSNQIILILIYLSCFYANEKSRKFIIGFSIFIIYWIIYDSMRALPNYDVSTVHIKGPYDLEKALFGISVNNVILTPNEYFASHTSRFLDLLSGLFYINWVPVPIAFGVYLFIKDKYLFTKFALVFFFVNLVGFIIYYIYPAAPPWYVNLYGFNFHLGIPGNSAGLSRFDNMTGIPIFASIYSKNANVLAAMPSLHSSYPVIVLFYGIKKKLGWFNILFVVFMLGIWFSAVYTSQHYIIDVIAGATLALIVIFVFEKLSKKTFLNKWVLDFKNNI